MEKWAVQLMRGPTQLSTVRRMTSETGQTTVEYALVLLLVAIALVASLVALNVPFEDFVGNLADRIAGLA
jgi:Flp pilus assembly pilin Flp